MTTLAIAISIAAAFLIGIMLERYFFTNKWYQLALDYKKLADDWQASHARQLALNIKWKAQALKLEGKEQQP